MTPDEPVVDGPRVVGAALRFTLAAPTTVVLPVQTGPEHGESGVPGAASVRITGATDVLVLVDVERQRVIDLQALGGTGRALLDSAGAVITDPGA